jgi:hypothetical protein
LDSSQRNQRLASTFHPWLCRQCPRALRSARLNRFGGCVSEFDPPTALQLSNRTPWASGTRSGGVGRAFIRSLCARRSARRQCRAREALTSAVVSAGWLAYQSGQGRKSDLKVERHHPALSWPLLALPESREAPKVTCLCRERPSARKNAGAGSAVVGLTRCGGHRSGWRHRPSLAG